jgi:hypothetical protein
MHAVNKSRIEKDYLISALCYCGFCGQHWIGIKAVRPDNVLLIPSFVAGTPERQEARGASPRGCEEGNTRVNIQIYEPAQKRHIIVMTVGVEPMCSCDGVHRRPASPSRRSIPCSKSAPKTSVSQSAYQYLCGSSQSAHWRNVSCLSSQDSLCVAVYAFGSVYNRYNDLKRTRQH